MRQTALVELRVSRGQAKSVIIQEALALNALGFQVDPNYVPVTASQPSDPKLVKELEASNKETVIVRGTIEADKIDKIKAKDNVVEVWLDTPIAPFAEPGL